MYPITNEVKALFEAEQRKVLRITGTDKNGATISITDDNVIADSFQVDRYSCNGEKLEIGTAIAAQMTLTLENGNGTYDDIAFEGAELFVEVGVADWTQNSPTVHWIPCGYFTPDEQPRRLSTISITALDRMTKFDAVVDGTQITTPITVANLVARVCTLRGVTLTQSITGLPNANVSLTSIPTGNTVTYRNLIAWCAGIMGTNAWFDWNGQLRFSWYANATGYASTIDNRYSSDMYENDLTVTGVKYTTTGGIDIVEGTDDYAIELTGNALASPMIAIILPTLNTALSGFTYRPFTAAVVNAPYLWPMDTVTFTDKDGNDHTSALTNVCFGLNGTTALESRGMTYILNRQKSPEGFTKEQAQLVNQAMEQVETNIDESLTQQEIFNRLTDNGAAQGLVLLNGQLYINASYINAGMLSVGRIGFNDVEGHYSVPNENDPASLLPDEAISGGWIVSTDSTNQIIRLLGCDYAVPLRGKTITIIFTYKTRIENGITNYRAFDPDDGAYGEYEEYWFPETEPPYVPPNPCTYTYTVPNDAENLEFWVYGCDGVKNISVSVSGTPITPPTIKFDYAGLKIGDLRINRDGNVILDGYFHISKPICFSNDVTLFNALSVGSGGTGITRNPSMLVNLDSGSAANVFQASPRPGVTGTLGVGYGGTNASNAADARSNLGAAALASPNNLMHSGNEFTFASDCFSGNIWFNYRTASGEKDGNITGYTFGDGSGCALAAITFNTFSGNAANVTGTVAIDHGGTGATSAPSARNNLGVFSGTSIVNFSNGVGTLAFSTVGISSKPAAFVATASNQSCFMRYDFDETPSSGPIKLYCIQANGTGYSGNIRFSWICIP